MFGLNVFYIKDTVVLTVLKQEVCRLELLVVVELGKQ